MWLKQKQKKGDLCTLDRPHFVLIADYKYYLVHCWTCICNAFSCTSFIYSVVQPPFSSFPKLFRRFVFQRNLSSWHYWPINHITLLVFFFFFPILSVIAVLLLPMYFYAETFLSPLTLIWSETNLFFESRWDSKVVESTNHFSVTWIMSFQPFRIFLSVLIDSW